MKFEKIASAVLATALLFTGAAQAASVNIASVSGSWSTVNPPDVVGLNGLGTSRMSWGTPIRRNQQSGYGFVGTGPMGLTTDTTFNIGTFTHFNNAIKSTPAGRYSISAATLSLIVDLVLDDGTQRRINSVFDFSHWETVNVPGRGQACADGGRYGVGVNRNGCADRVIATRNEGSSDSFTYGGLLYRLDITGFLRNGQLVSSFWTTEGLANTAVLQAVLRTSPVDTPPPDVPAPVPLPAAGWLLLGALGGLAAFRRRR